MKNKILKGVIAVLPTPLDAKENIDEVGIRSVINFLSPFNIPIFALGSAGEGMNLTLDDRIIASKAIARANNGKNTVLIGGGTFGLKDSLNFIDAISSEKIDGIHVIPYDNKISPYNIKNFYKELADNSPLPIWIYQNTTRTNGIPIDVVSELSLHPNIHGIKIAGFDLRLNQSFMTLNSDEFQVFGSADSQFFSFICHGLQASSSSSAACFPELFLYLYNCIMSNDLNHAQEVNKIISRFLKTLPRGAYKDNGESAAEVKYLLSLRGICSEYVAKPYRIQNVEEKEIAKKAYKKYTNFLSTNDINELVND